MWTPRTLGLLRALVPPLPLDSHPTGHQSEVTSVRLACAQELLPACLETTDQFWPRQTGNFAAIQWAIATPSLIRFPALGKGRPSKFVLSWIFSLNFRIL